MRPLPPITTIFMVPVSLFESGRGGSLPLSGVRRKRTKRVGPDVTCPGKNQRPETRNCGHGSIDIGGNGTALAPPLTERQSRLGLRLDRKAEGCAEAIERVHRSDGDRQVD